MTMTAMPLSFNTDDPLSATVANKAQFEMYAVPYYARLQIPLRMGSDMGISTLSHWPTFSAELRKLATVIDELHAEIRTTQILRTQRLLNSVRHANRQMVVDSPRKQK